MSFHEIVYFQRGPVFISYERAVFGVKTYSVADIHSVFATRQPPNRSAGLFVALVSLLIACFSAFYQILELLNPEDRGLAPLTKNIDFSTYFFLFGTVTFFLFIALVAAISAAREQPTYIVSIKNSSGVIDVFASQNREWAVEIINALKQAIADRENQALPAQGHIYI